MPSQDKLWETHQNQLFSVAFPKNSIEAKKAHAALDKTSILIKKNITNSKNDWSETGVLGSHIEYSFTFPALSWLVDKFPKDVEIQFDDEELSDDFLSIASLLVSPIKKEGLDHTDLSTKSWLKAASGNRHTAKWLVEKLNELDVPEKVKNYLYEKMEVYIRWDFNNKSATQTFARFPIKRNFTHPEGLIKKVNPTEVLNKKLPKPTKLSKQQLQKLIDCCKFTIYSRSREIDTLNFINEKETYLYQLGRGYDLCLFGMQPESRLGLDSYHGFVLAKKLCTNCLWWRMDLI